MLNQHLILASASPQRQMLLKRLKLPFIIHTPEIDETPLIHETADELVSRLSISKAKTVAKQHQDALVIGADTIGEVNNHLLFKPLTKHNAIEQLTSMSGNIVRFYTGLCLFNSANNTFQETIEIYQINFKKLSYEQIKSYVEIDEPLYSSGSIKAESFAVSLFDSCEGNDYTALIGLPLIALCKMLQHAGINLFMT